MERLADVPQKAEECRPVLLDLFQIVLGHLAVDHEDFLHCHHHFVDQRTISPFPPQY